MRNNGKLCGENTHKLTEGGECGVPRFALAYLKLPGILSWKFIGRGPREVLKRMSFGGFCLNLQRVSQEQAPLTVVDLIVLQGWFAGVISV